MKLVKAMYAMRDGIECIVAWSEDGVEVWFFDGAPNEVVQMAEDDQDSMA